MKTTEIEHFNKLLKEANHIWWGHNTKTGKMRLNRRAEILIEYLNPTKESKILEIGCGLGALTQRIINCEAQIIATDINLKMLELVKENIKADNVSFVYADSENLNFEDNIFNAIFGNSILHHLDISLALPEIKRVLKINGKIIFFEPNMMNPHIFAERHILYIRKKLDVSPDETAFYRWQMTKDLLKANFKNVQVIPFDFLYPLIPAPLINFAKKLESLFEKLPIIKEISGSLIIKAEK